MGPSAVEIEGFVETGFLRIDGAFPREVAKAGRDILWRETGCDPDDPSTWTRPVIRLGGYHDPPFREAAGAPAVRAAIDAIVGVGRWAPLMGLGTWPVRFPHPDPPGDDGWHIDVSFGGEAADFLSWRANVNSKGRALLALFLFSDVGPDDAPTRLRVGSHAHVARMLAPAGEDGLSLREIAAGLGPTEACVEALATGAAGTVYLCHPFLVHAAQAHRGREPKFMAQPPVFPKAPVTLERADGDYSPVERAIRDSLGVSG